MSNASEQHAPATRGGRIDTRFSIPELSLVQKVAGWRGLRPSAFVRGAALAAARQAEGHGIEDDGGSGSTAAALAVEQMRMVDAARIDVKHIGVNLNQLVHFGHRGQLDLRELAPVLEELAAGYELMVDRLGGKGQS